MRRSKTFQFKEDPSSKNAQSLAVKKNEALLIMNFVQTKPEIKSRIIYCYDL